MKKRGQGSEHIVIYVMIAVVSILILTFGYKAFESGKRQHQKTAIINFETNFKTDLESIKRNAGSVVEKVYPLTPDIKEVCIQDAGCGYISEDCWDFNRDIIEDMSEQEYNVFLMPEDRLPIGYNMGKIKIKSEDDKSNEINFRTVCIPTKNGKLYLRLEGGGNKVYIKPVWPVEKNGKQETEPIKYKKNDDDSIEWILPTG